MKRPVNINLLKIKLPLTALLSITHRLSGMFVFFIVLPLTAISLYYLAQSLESYEQFTALIESNFSLVIIKLYLAPLQYHRGLPRFRYHCLHFLVESLQRFLLQTVLHC